MMKELRNLISKVRNHEFLKNPTLEYQEYKDFKDSWFEVDRYFWGLIRKTQAPYEEYKKFPHKDVLFSCKAGLLTYMMTHDINSTLLYYLFYKNKETGEFKKAFDFLEFWEGTLSKYLDFVENWISGRDTENPNTVSFKVWWNRELRESKISVYNISGTPWWRKAEYITSKEEAEERLRESKKLLKEFEDYDKEHVLKYGWRSNYHIRVLGDLQNEIDLLTGVIGNDESTWLVVKYEN